MAIRKAAIKAVATETTLDNDLSEFLLSEISENADACQDEDGMADVIGEHLLSFGVITTKDLAWVTCDKILKRLNNLGITVDNLLTEEEEAEDALDDDEGELLEPGQCPICERFMPLTFHHLTPKTTHKKYKKLGYNTADLSRGVNVCRPCHSQIHRLIPNEDLAATYNTLEKILPHPGIQQWIPYIRKQKLTCKCDVRVLHQVRPDLKDLRDSTD